MDEQQSKTPTQMRQISAVVTAASPTPAVMSEEVFRSSRVQQDSKTPYSDATQVSRLSAFAYHEVECRSQQTCASLILSSAYSFFVKGPVELP